MDFDIQGNRGCGAMPVVIFDTEAKHRDQMFGNWNDPNCRIWKQYGGNYMMDASDVVLAKCGPRYCSYVDYWTDDARKARMGGMAYLWVRTTMMNGEAPIIQRFHDLDDVANPTKKRKKVVQFYWLNVVHQIQVQIQVQIQRQIRIHIKKPTRQVQILLLPPPPHF